MDLPSIAAALASAKALKDIVQGLTQLKIENSTLAPINEAMNRVNDLLGSLFDAREEQFRLQKENHELLMKLQVRDDWNGRLAEYKKQQTPGGAVVYESMSDSPKHYACPCCIEKREIQILQTAGGSGLFECPNCKKFYQVNVRPPVQQPRSPRYKFGDF